MPAPSQIPDDFLRAMSDATEAFKALNEQTERSTKQTERNSEGGLAGGLIGKLKGVAGGAAIGAAVGAFRGGVFGSNTNDASFGTNARNSLLGGFASATGFGLRGRNAIEQAGSQTAGFFADAVANGGQVSGRERNQVLDFFQQRNDRVQEFQRGLEGEVTRRQEGRDPVANAIDNNGVILKLGEILAAIERWGYEAANTPGGKR